MTFAQIQADAEAHLANVRATVGSTAEHVEKTTQLVCVLASELAARETGKPPVMPKPNRTRKASAAR